MKSMPDRLMVPVILNFQQIADSDGLMLLAHALPNRENE
jgi:hypothetical protein